MAHLLNGRCGFVPVIFADLCYGAHYQHTVASAQAIEERTVQEMGRSDAAVAARDGVATRLARGADSPATIAAGAKTLVEATTALVGAFWSVPGGNGHSAFGGDGHSAFGGDGHSAYGGDGHHPASGGNGHAPGANGYGAQVGPGHAGTAGSHNGNGYAASGGNGYGASGGNGHAASGGNGLGASAPVPPVLNVAARNDAPVSPAVGSGYAGGPPARWADAVGASTGTDHHGAAPTSGAPSGFAPGAYPPDGPLAGHASAAGGVTGRAGLGALLDPLVSPLDGPLEASPLADFAPLPAPPVLDPAPWEASLSMPGPVPTMPDLGDDPWSATPPRRREPAPGPVNDPTTGLAEDTTGDLSRHGAGDNIAAPRAADSRAGGPHAERRATEQLGPLPTRVPGRPDVPEVPPQPADPLVDPASTASADKFELSRIHKFLNDRYDHSERTEGFDVSAILDAVRDVPEVRDAQLRWNPGGVHTLRLDLVEGADAGRVTREVARLLKAQMGLAAEPRRAVTTDESTLDRPRGTAAPLHRPYVAGNGAAAPAGPVRGVATPNHPAAGAAHAVAAGMAGLAAGRAVAQPGAPRIGGAALAPRPVLDHVQVTTLGHDATVEVRLDLPAVEEVAIGTAQGPAVDAYLLRLAANAAVSAVDQLLVDARTNAPIARCFIEHVGLIPFGGCEVALVVLLLVRGSLVEQLSGSSLVAGDPRQAVVRATLSALNRRLAELLA
jgi:hypothetical protein